MIALFALIATLHLTAKANHHTYTVKLQTPIVVALKESPSTGYHWIYKPATGGRKIVKLSSTRYVPPKKGSARGAAGKQVWHLRAVHKGTMYMQFFYVPPGLMGSPAKKILLAIHVRAS